MKANGHLDQNHGDDLHHHRHPDRNPPIKKVQATGSFRTGCLRAIDAFARHESQLTSDVTTCAGHACRKAFLPSVFETVFNMTRFFRFASFPATIQNLLVHKTHETHEREFLSAPAPPDRMASASTSHQLVCKIKVMFPVEALLVVGTSADVVADVAGEADLRLRHLWRQHFVVS